MRFALVLLIMFSLPFIGFAIWRVFRKDDAPKMPVHVLIIIGGVLSVLAMLALALTSIEGDRYDGAYTPQRLEDGEIRPGQFEPRDQEPDDTDDPPAPR